MYLRNLLLALKAVNPTQDELFDPYEYTVTVRSFDNDDSDWSSFGRSVKCVRMKTTDEVLCLDLYPVYPYDEDDEEGEEECNCLPTAPGDVCWSKYRATEEEFGFTPYLYSRTKPL